MSEATTATNGKRTRRAFGPSNEPDTCLYCGTKLFAHPGKEYTTRNTVSLCCQARLDHAMERDPNGEHGWSMRTVYKCSACKRELVGDDEDTETVERTSVIGRSDTKGYDGRFCTLNCGYRFGCLAADRGVRYRRRTPEGT